MEILTGSKREITIQQWQEQLEKCVKQLNDSMECFRRFHEDSDAEHIAEDAERIMKIAKSAKDSIYNMDLMDVK